MSRLRKAMARRTKDSAMTRPVNSARWRAMVCEKSSWTAVTPPMRTSRPVSRVAAGTTWLRRWRTRLVVAAACGAVVGITRAVRMACAPAPRVMVGDTTATPGVCPMSDSTVVNVLRADASARSATRTSGP